MIKYFGMRSLSARVTTASVAGIIVALLMTVLVSSLAMTSDSQKQKVVETQDRNMRIAWSVLKVPGQELREADSKLYVGSHLLDGSQDVVDQIQDLTHSVATVFHGDLRVATNLKNLDGSRATGTRLQPGPVYDAVLHEGRPYRGEAEILGARYFVAYDPIKSATGAVVGALFVGMSEAEVFGPVRDFQTRAILLSLITTTVIALVLLGTTRRLFAPLHGLRVAMERLAIGEHTTEIPGVERVDDLGDMARAVAAFKDNAVEKVRLGLEATAARQREELETRRAAALQVTTAQQQTQVVQSIAAGLDQLAQGNLTVRLDTAFAPEYEKLRADFNRAIGQLKDTISVIAVSTSAIRTGTAEISTASDDLSRRTEQQAASLEETAAALDEITATVKKTSDGSIHARTVVASTKSDAERSGTVVAQAVEAMSAIETSAQQVSQIIGVIDEIAFQTNLLALNAGVEAARAGEAGRGFAVVASEVRALAQRSAEAAKEIKALISTSSQQVSTGVNLVNETGSALKRIVTQVAEINAVVSDIATSTQEQATALQEVNTAINQMDQVTQQNAAMVEESTAASKNLAQETEELARVVGQFQLDATITSPDAPSGRTRATPATTTALKPRGNGGAARKPEISEQSWEEF